MQVFSNVLGEVFLPLPSVLYVAPAHRLPGVELSGALWYQPTEFVHPWEFDMKTIRILLILILVSGSFVASVPRSAEAQTTRVWSTSEILAERNLRSPGRAKSYCQGGVFQPCVCAKDVSRRVQYRPAVKECGGNAAIVLSGRYLTAFSVVVRDWENKDRWPAEGANNCSAYERDVLGLNKCSVFKVQKIFNVSHPKGAAEVHCLGASGYSALFRRVVRITVKLADVPGSNADPLERLCLWGPTDPLN